jgi:hypothetical protein
MDFGGGLLIPSGKGLNKNFGNTTISSSHRATCQHQLLKEAYPLVNMY